MTVFKWHLRIINWNDIQANKYGGDVYCNTYIEKFIALDDVWDFLGFKLKKQRTGYSGIKDNIEYVLTRV